MTNPTLYLAIDPAIKKECWIKYSYANVENLFPLTIHFMLTNIEHEIERTLDGLVVNAIARGIKSKGRIVAAIEKPENRWRQNQEMKVVANAIAAAIRRIAPRRNKIFFVDPRVWQAAMLSGAPGADTKAQSCFVASAIAGREITNDNEADAVCLFDYAEKRGWEL